MGLRILIADDDEDLREVLGELLAAWGHEVTSAADGLTAVRLGLQQRPDVALIDISLPGLDGAAAARRIRAGTDGKVFTVALTGHLTNEASKDFDCFLLKPASTEELQRILEGRQHAAA